MCTVQGRTILRLLGIICNILNAVYRVCMGTSLQKNKPSCGEVKPPFQIRDPYNEVCFCGQGHIQGGQGGSAPP